MRNNERGRQDVDVLEVNYKFPSSNGLICRAILQILDQVSHSTCWERC